MRFRDPTRMLRLAQYIVSRGWIVPLDLLVLLDEAGFDTEAILNGR